MGFIKIKCIFFIMKNVIFIDFQSLLYRHIVKRFDKKIIEIAMRNSINYFKYIIRISKAYCRFNNKKHELNCI